MKDSSTRHLLNVLIAARDLSIDTSFISGWKRVFGTQSDIETNRKIGLIYRLIDSAAQEVLQIDPDQSSSVDHWRNQLYSGFTHASAMKWPEFKKFIDDHTINYLKMQATLVEITNQESAIDPEELDRARALLVEAISEILSSNLSPSSKAALTRKLKLLIIAIDDYSMTGNEAIFIQFKSTIYDFAASAEVREKGLGEKLAQAVEILANIIASANGLQQLAAPVAKLLGLGK